MKPAPIKDRIAAALRDGPKNYHAVLDEVFPREQFPRAGRISSNGGPPGCAMAFGRALRELGVREKRTQRHGRGTLTLPKVTA